MAYPDDRYWVGGGGVWTPTSTTNWSYYSGGVAGAPVPTSANSVFFDQAGTYTVYVSNAGELPCKSLTVSAGTVKFDGAYIGIYENLSVKAGTVFSNTINFRNSTLATATITTNGSSFYFVSFYGNNTYQLQDNLTVQSSTYLFDSCTLDLNNKILSTDSFFAGYSSTSNNTINFGTGSITVTGSSYALYILYKINTTGSRQVNLTGNASKIINGVNNSGTLTINNSLNVSISTSTAVNVLLGGAFTNIDLTGSSCSLAVSNYSIYLFGDLTLSSTWTYNVPNYIYFSNTSSTQKITSNGATLGYVLSLSASTGVQLQDALNITGQITLGNNSTLDLNSKTLTSSSGITVQSSSAVTIAFGTGNITFTGTGSVFYVPTGSGTTYTVSGTPVVNISPTVAGDIYFYGKNGTTEANSINVNVTTGSNNVTIYDVVRSLNFTGYSGSATLAASFGAGSVFYAYGDVTFSSSMTLSSIPNPSSLRFSKSSGTQTFTTNGRTISSPITCSANKLVFADNVTSSSSCGLVSGTLDLNGKTLTASSFSATGSGSTVKNLTFNGGTVSLSGNFGVPFTVSNFTTTAGTGTGAIRFTGSSNKTFYGAGVTYNCIVSNDGAGTLTISNNNTFNTLTNGVSPTGFSFANGTTQTITNFNISGTAGNLVSMYSSIGATISCATKYIDMSYMSFTNITATGGAAWYANTTCVNVAGNNGIIFSTPEKFFLFFVDLP